MFHMTVVEIIYTLFNTNYVNTEGMKTSHFQPVESR